MANNEEGVMQGLDTLTATIGKSGVINRKIGSVFELPISEIEVEAQVRTNFEDIADLAKSIALEGQRMPLEVAAIAGKQKYLIITGERRYRALKKNKAKVALVKLVKMPKSQSERLQLQITENLQRSDLSLIELSKAFSDLSELGMSQKEIAQAVNKSQAMVSKIIAVKNYTPQVMELLRSKETQDLALLGVLDQICRLDTPVYEQLEEQLVTDGLSRAKAAETLKQLKGEPSTSSPEKENNTADKAKQYSKKEIEEHHYSRSAVEIQAGNFRATVTAKMLDGEKVSGQLRLDRVVDGAPDMVWLETDEGQTVAVDAKTVRIKQVES